MHKLEETAYGLRLGLEGFTDREAMAALLEEVRAYCRGAPVEIGALFDLRRAAAFPAEAQEVFKQCLQELRGCGLGRHAVVVSGALATLQAKRLWREAGTAAWCRFLDAAVVPQWEAAALGWIEAGHEPPA